MLLDLFPSFPPPPEWSQGRTTRKPHVCSLGNSLNMRRSHCLAGFLSGGVRTEATPRGRGLGWNFHPNVPDSLGIWMPGAVLTQTGASGVSEEVYLGREEGRAVMDVGCILWAGVTF